MKSFTVIVCVLIWAFSAMAETYSWIDDNGTVNFSDEFSNIPQKFRNKSFTRGDMSNSLPEQQAPAYSVSEKSADRIKPSEEKGEAGLSSGNELFGGRKIVEWKRELDALENELKSLDAKTKEVEEERRKMVRGGYSREDMQLQSEKMSATVDAYNEALERHGQLVESAKKAGVPINIKK